MTDTPNQDETQTKPAKSGRFIIPVIVVVILIAVVGYFAAMQSGLDKAVVEEALNNWAEQVEAYAARENEELVFAYDGVEMKSGATDRHAVIKNPRFITEVMRGDETEPTELVFRTESATLHPQSIRFDTLLVRLDQPIMIVAEGTDAGRIAPNTPIEIEVRHREENQQQLMEARMPIPSQIEVESLVDEENVTISMDEGAQMATSMVVGERGHGSFYANISQLQMVDFADEVLLSVKELMIDSESAPAAVEQPEATASGREKMYDVRLNARVEELMGRTEEMPYGAISAAVDVDYTGPLPREGETIDWAAVPAEINVRELMLKTADAAISANGDFKSGSGDLLPVGSAQLQVNNFPFIRAELRKRDGLKPEEEKIIDALLRRMVGTGFEETEAIDIALKREPGGSLHIGNMTFEEALAIVLTGGKLAPKEPTQLGESEPAPAPEDAEPAAGNPDNNQQ